MAHYIIITPDDIPTINRNVEYRASCKCGWMDTAAAPAEIAQVAQTHLDTHNTDAYAYDWRAPTLDSIEV